MGWWYNRFGYPIFCRRRRAPHVRSFPVYQPVFHPVCKSGDAVSSFPRTTSSAPGGGCGSPWRSAEQKQGLPITDEQIAELEAHKDDINYDDAQRREKECRHDVMSHVYAYGLQCPKARGIIHLGATSCYVGDNTDVIIMTRGPAAGAPQAAQRHATCLRAFAEKYKALPALAYTHFAARPADHRGQARHPVAATSCYMDLEEMEHRIGTLALLGSKGTTGTQASFMELLDGDSGKIKPARAGHRRGDGLYPRGARLRADLLAARWTTMVVNTLARHRPERPASSANDMRLLQNFKEMEEPFEASQIGSSAMPYKRNPMRCERITSLGPLCDGGRAQPRHHRRHPVVRAHAGRLAPTSASPWPRRSWRVDAILNIYDQRVRTGWWCTQR